MSQKPFEVNFQYTWRCTGSALRPQQLRIIGMTIGHYVKLTGYCFRIEAEPGDLVLLL